MSDQENLKIVDAFLTAWGQASVDGVLEIMHENCVFAASVGPEPGTTYKGKESIRASLLPILLSELDGEQSVGRKWVAGNFVFVEWTYEKKINSDSVLVVRGLDIIHIVNSKIAHIDAYRKSIV